MRALGDICDVHSRVDCKAEGCDHARGNATPKGYESIVTAFIEVNKGARLFLTSPWIHNHYNGFRRFWPGRTRQERAVPYPIFSPSLLDPDSQTSCLA